MEQILKRLKMKKLDIEWNSNSHLEIAEIFMEAKDNISSFDGCKEMAMDLMKQDPKEAKELLKNNKHKINYLYGEDVVHAYPNGWSCISCGAEFTEKTINVECLYAIQTKEGVECLKCVNEREVS